LTVSEPGANRPSSELWATPNCPTGVPTQAISAENATTEGTAGNKHRDASIG